ncbi:MAG: adenosine kinase [Rhodospirillaceae bacterium]|jgi:sugar/nucleoside kinase (ribokinase family)|nr:adenosine kinase [Rhodospirillaceae bacterium]MBT5564707.1 adenosine kinase [Rhodospirillaceae bacterium]MBT6090160.1 adenosine kinase [Rhodospirillaceae bacterium]
MSEARFDVVGIGSAIVDVLAHAEDVFLSKHDAAKGTMLMVDEDQSDALYKDIGPAIEASGGSAANTMAGIASFGGKPAFIGKTMSDELGGIFGHDIRAVGVHYDTEPLTSGLATARCIILVTPDAQRTMFTYLGASGSLSAADMNEDLIAASKVLYIEGYQWDLPETKQAIIGACETVSRSGGKVALTLSDPFVVERHRNDLFDLVNEYVDIVFANEQEITTLFRSNSFDEAVEALEGRVDMAALTRGADGAVTVTKDKLIQTPAAPAGKVVDTTGAGDLYAAGFLFGYTRGDDLRTCANLGALAAGEVICHLGARPEVSLKDLAAKHGY